MIMDYDRYISRRKKAKAEKKKKSYHIWLVETRVYRGSILTWVPAGDRNGDYRLYNTRESARNRMRIRYHGHKSNLRVRKYVREEA